MQAIITEKLPEIAKANQLTILFACESGSRGWQFASPDSDYDVRFIYTRPYHFYLSVQDREYDIQFPIEGELDMYGWDLRKALQLIKKSNTTPFEWLQSPIVYAQQPGFRDALWSLCQQYFSQRANTHHYLGIARGAMETIENGDEIKIKKLFYILRPLLAAKWCFEKNSIAPMTIGPLMSLLPPALKQLVSELISLKANAAEGFIIKIDKALHQYIHSEFTRLNEASNSLPRNEFPAAPLDEFFVKTITYYDDK